MFPWKTQCPQFSLSMIVLIKLSKIIDFLINLPTNYANFPGIPQSPVIRASNPTPTYLNKSGSFFHYCANTQQQGKQVTTCFSAEGNFYPKNR